MGLPCGGGGGGEALFGSAWSCTSSRKLKPKLEPAARKRTSGGGLFGDDDDGDFGGGGGSGLKGSGLFG